MIFIAVGTQKFPLDRLLRKVDELIVSGEITQPVFAQIGHSAYRPQKYDYTDFLSSDEFSERISQCDLLLTHSGVGTIITGIQNNKPTIVFPRLAKYAEHVDDHQLEIATAFTEKNLVLLCNDGDDLAELIGKAMQHNFSPYHSRRDKMISTIKDYLDSV